MTAAAQLAEVREALADMRNADDCAEYKLRVLQVWGKDVHTACASPLPHWLVVAGLQAMERELMAQEVTS